MSSSDSLPDPDLTTQPQVAKDVRRIIRPTEKENEGSKERVPYIYLKDGSLWRTLAPAIHSQLENAILGRYNGKFLRIMTYSWPDYRKTLEILEAGKHEFFFYELPEHKKKFYVIKGLPGDVDNATVEGELKSLFDVIYVTQLRSKRKGRKPLPHLLVALKNTKTSSQIMKLKSICEHEITVEPLAKSSEVRQCYRCMAFFHSSKQCRSNPVCVKCAGAHWSSECKITSPDELKCANCGGNHTASFRGCSKYIKVMMTMDARRSKLRNSATSEQNTQTD